MTLNKIWFEEELNSKLALSFLLTAFATQLYTLFLIIYIGLVLLKPM